jgi:hypothetical protein
MLVPTQDAFGYISQIEHFRTLVDMKISILVWYAQLVPKFCLHFSVTACILFCKFILVQSDTCFVRSGQSWIKTSVLEFLLQFYSWL